MSGATIRFTGCVPALPDERPDVSIPFKEVLTNHKRLATARGIVLALLNCPEWMRDHTTEEAEAWLAGGKS